MIFHPGRVHGARTIELERREDDRGFFARLWCRDEFARAGLVSEFAQINTGVSRRSGTLRGMHFQVAPHLEVKVVRCVRGAVFDVVIDLRPDSSTFRQWMGLTLTETNGLAVYVPEGCAHGYLTLADEAEVTYLASVPYAPGSARGVRFDDPAFAIEWPAKVEVVSVADRSWPDYTSEQG